MLNMNKLLSFIQNVELNTSEALEQILEVGEQTAKAHAAVDTGAMQASIHVQKISDTNYQLVAGTNLPDDRAISNEFGTHKLPAQPFMLPSVPAMQKEANNHREFK